MYKETNRLIALTSATVVVGAMVPAIEVKAETTQTPEEAKALIEASLSYFLPENDTTEAKIIDAALVDIQDPAITVTTSNFNKVDATTSETGKLYLDFDITKEGTTPAQVSYIQNIQRLGGPTPIQSSQTTQDLKEAILAKENELVVDEATISEGIVNEFAQLITNTNISIGVTGFTNSPINSTTGAITMHIILTDITGASTEEKFDIYMQYGLSSTNTTTVTTQTANMLMNEVNSTVIEAYNDSTEADVLNQVNALKTNSNLNIQMTDFDLVKSTFYRTGYIQYGVLVTDSVTGESVSAMKIAIIDKMENAFDDSLRQQISDSIIQLNPDNSTSSETLITNTQNYLKDSTLTIEVPSFSIKYADTTTAGAVHAVITATRADGTGASVDFEKTFIYDGVGASDYETRLIEEMDNMLLQHTFEKGITNDALAFWLQTYLGREDIVVYINELPIESIVSTADSETVSARLGLVNKYTDEVVDELFPITFETTNLMETRLASEISTIKEELDRYPYTNSTYVEQIESKLNAAIDTTSIDYAINNFKLTPVTTTTLGAVSLDLTVVDLTSYKYDTVHYSKEFSATNTTSDNTSSTGNSDSTTDTGTAEDIDSVLEKALYYAGLYRDNYPLTNYTTVDSLTKGILSSMVNSDVDVEIQNFTKTVSTTTTEGSCSCTVALFYKGKEVTMTLSQNLPKVNTSGTTVTQDQITAKLAEAERLTELAYEAVQDYNKTRKEEIGEMLAVSLKDTHVAFTMTNFTLVPATESHESNLSFDLTLTYNGETVEVPYSAPVYEGYAEGFTDVDYEEFLGVKAQIEDYMDKLVVTNDITVESAEDRLILILHSHTGMAYDMVMFDLEPATTSAEGKLLMHVGLSYKGAYVAMDFAKIVAKLTDGSVPTDNNGSTNGSTDTTNPPTSSSSHHSSGGSSSGTSSSGSSNASIGTSTMRSTATVGTTGTTTKPVHLAEVSREVAKAIEQQVISNVTSILGEGTKAVISKEIQASDGNKLTVTGLVKDGKDAGLVISAEKSSAIATIQVDISAGEVTAVYKFVPLLNKYIQVTDNVEIGENTITLPTQANATYVAATNKFATTDVISQGWVKVDSNWYMVDKTGEPLTGWQKDSTNQWVYLSPTDANMETGWKQDAGQWYLLKDNGYMATGWVKTGTKWYYLNSNGSMASNTTVDGYTLGSDGALV